MKPIRGGPYGQADAVVEERTALELGHLRAEGLERRVVASRAMDAVAWLLASDPAIRWQTLRDLTDASPVEVHAERERVAHEGMAHGILARQGADGAWHREGKPDWMPTLYTLQLLRTTGVDPRDPRVQAALERLSRGFRWHEEFGAKTFLEGEVEPCINGAALAVGGYFHRPQEALLRRLLNDQLEDGGWNCAAPPSTRSSFHSTLCVLEGLLEYERAAGDAPEVTAARRRGEAYLLERGLFRRLSNGTVAHAELLELAYPPRYHYDILRALDYLRDARITPDARIDDAVELLVQRKQADGRFVLERSYDEALDVPFSERPGEPSRWNTLRALRVMRWYERSPRS